MAGNGPAPKPKGIRRNTSAPLRGEWIDITEPSLREPSQPMLEGAEWQGEDRERWNAWRHDPVSAYWSPGDVIFAKETLRCYRANRVNWAEIRQRMNELGLTPQGKRDLRFRIVFAPWRDTSLDTPEQRGIPNLADHRRQQLQRGA